MYKIYWTTFMGQFWKPVPEKDVNEFMGALAALNFAIDKVEMS